MPTPVGLALQYKVLQILQELKILQLVVVLVRHLCRNYTSGVGRVQLQSQRNVQLQHNTDAKRVAIFMTV